MKIRDAEILFLNENENSLSHVLLFGSDKLNDLKNLCIPNATVKYILSTERFNVLLCITEIHNRPKDDG